MLGARLGEAPIDLDNAEGGYCVVISISKAHSKGDTSIIYGRKIDGDESGEGQPFRLAKRDFRYIWQNKEVTDEKIRFGSVVKYAQVEDEYLFQGNTKRPRQVSWCFNADHENACMSKTKLTVLVNAVVITSKRNFMAFVPVIINGGIFEELLHYSESNVEDYKFSIHPIEPFACKYSNE